MFIYNVTTKVSWEVHERWLEWMISEHIPEILQTGYFTRYQLVRLQEVDDIDGPTYAVQYYIDTKATYNAYITTAAPALRQKSISKWGDHVIAFRTLMEVIN